MRCDSPSLLLFLLPCALFSCVPPANGIHETNAGAGGDRDHEVTSGAGGLSGASGDSEGGGGSGAVDSCDDDRLIDDLEDGDVNTCRSKGSWYLAKHASPGDLEANIVFPIAGGRDGSQYAARLQGSNFEAIPSTNGLPAWGALLGISLNSSGNGEAPYAATAYAGIRFFVLADQPILVRLKTKDTLPLSLGGSVPNEKCAQPISDCHNYFSREIPPFKDFSGRPTSRTAWREIEVRFDDLTQLWPGTLTRVNQAELLGIQFQPVDWLNEPFDVWIDDPSFFYAISDLCSLRGRYDDRRCDRCPARDYDCNCESDGHCTEQCDADPDCRPACPSDGLCMPECGLQDPDCCAIDAYCDAACGDADPDCVVVCEPDQFCERACVALPDPDCAPASCSDECEFEADGQCDDGGTGSATELCVLGTDCADCGPR